MHIVVKRRMMEKRKIKVDLVFLNTVPNYLKSEIEVLNCKDIYMFYVVRFHI